MTETVHSNSPIRPFTLKVEAERTISSPSADDVRAVIDRMNPNGGPSFIVLEGRGDEYAQVAGGDGVFTAEWREYFGGEFQHWKAGLHGRPNTGYAEVRTNGHHVSVRPNERLTASDALIILGAFLAGRERPSEYVWREMTLRELSASTEGNGSALAELESFARESLHADRFPNACHRFGAYNCPNCSPGPLRLQIEHNSGSEDGNFKGVIVAHCPAV